MRSGKEPKTIERHHHEDRHGTDERFVAKAIPEREIIQRLGFEEIRHDVRRNVEAMSDRKCDGGGERSRDLPSEKSCGESHDAVRENRSEFKRRTSGRDRIEQRTEDTDDKSCKRTEEETADNRHHHVHGNDSTRNERVRLNRPRIPDECIQENEDDHSEELGFAVCTHIEGEYSKISCHALKGATSWRPSTFITF